MDWKTPPKKFSYILFEHVDLKHNKSRFYYLAYAQTLIGYAVIRVYGRKGGWQRTVTPKPFTTLDEAWPEVRKHIRARLRHGYQVVQPSEYREA